MTEQQKQEIDTKANEVYVPSSEFKLHFIDGMKEVIDHPEKYGLKPRDLGTCNRCNQAPAITDYNGHGHYVCQHCDNILNDEFDEEYR